MAGLDLLDGLLTDLRWIAECDCEEQGGNRQAENEDVSEAFHQESPRERSAEGGGTRGRNISLG